MKHESRYGQINIQDYNSHNPHTMQDIKSTNPYDPYLKHEQFAKNSQHLSQKELTRLEVEALYWKLLAPLNFKMLEGKFILVCPLCDMDLGTSQDKMIYRSHFVLEATVGQRIRAEHDAKCSEQSKSPPKRQG